ncbi:MAG: flagellar M-ring protein FliF [Treponema sp.]|jgi:flagellar M-ring protein FliF|nr:flagellar M-ring protein FliF [Treponema sp.]
MNGWFKKAIDQIKGLWGKWRWMQRGILIGITAAVIAGLIALVSVSSAPTLAPVFDTAFKEEDRDRIIARINEEGVRATVNASGIIMVEDAKTAQRIRAILIREDMVPAGTDPWAIFDRDRWTITDFERNVNLRRSITQMVTDHIKSFDDVDDANVTIVMPQREYFMSYENPVTASVIITPKPLSDISQNRKKIEGIQKILKFAVEGLKDENIVIADQNGLVLNDFAGMADFDWIAKVEKETKLVQTLELKYRALVLQALQVTFSSDRVRDLNIKIDMDMSKKAVSTEEFYPVTIKPRTPGLSYDDSESARSITRSFSTSSTAWEGSGLNPEGPAGVEGQTPPAFRDMDNLYGKVNQETRTQNEEINSRRIEEEKSPGIDRVTVAVNIDGTWKLKYDEKRNPVEQADGSLEREYTPVPLEDLRAAEALIQDAIGFNAARGDSVTVQNIRFDRTREFAEADAAYRRQKQMQTTILVALSGVALLLVAFIVFRIITRELERRRRAREEELARQHQEMRERAFQEAEEQGVEVSMSVEERKRMELQENAINMAKEHPGDVAQLIRTWLLEE